MKELRCEIVRGNINEDGSKAKTFFEIDDPKEVTRVRTWNWKSGVTGSVYTFTLSNIEQIDYRTYLIKQKYEHMS